MDSKYIVLDASTFILFCDPRNFAPGIYYTTKDIANEVRDKKARDYLNLLPFELIYRKPSSNSISKVVNYVQKVGEFLTLSSNDIELIALAVDLVLEKNEENLLKFEIKSDKVEKKKIEKSDTNLMDEWITPENFKNKFPENPTPVCNISVGIITSDFGIQNVALQLGFFLYSPNGKMIKDIRQFLLRCTGCLWICKDLTQQFCDKCGNNTLEKVSFQVDSMGNTRIGQFRKRINLRGTKYSIPVPKGGHKKTDLILNPDDYSQAIKKTQKINKKLDERINEAINGENPFAMEISESAHIKSLKAAKHIKVGYGKTNPNIARKKKK